MTLRGVKPRQELRLWSCERCGRIDQDLAWKASTLGTLSEIGVCSCQDIVGIKTSIGGTPNPGIESGIGILLIRVGGDFSFVGD